jgi:hypothetical protein
MIARFDHRPMLTAVLALSTIGLFVVVVTLSTLLITAAPQAASPSSGSVGGKPAAATHKGMDAGGEKYAIYDYYSHQPKPAHIDDSKTSDSTERQEVGHP